MKKSILALIILFVNGVLFGQTIISQFDFENLTSEPDGRWTKSHWNEEIYISTGGTYGWDSKIYVVDTLDYNGNPTGTLKFELTGGVYSSSHGGWVTSGITSDNKEFTDVYVSALIFTDADFVTGESKFGVALGNEHEDIIAGQDHPSGDMGFISRWMVTQDHSIKDYNYEHDGCTGSCYGKGDNFNHFNFPHGQWLWFTKRVVMNTGNNFDGFSETFVNGQLVGRTTGERWLESGYGRIGSYQWIMVNYRGGGDASFIEAGTDNVYYDKVVLWTDSTKLGQPTTTGEINLPFEVPVFDKDRYVTSTISAEGNYSTNTLSDDSQEIFKIIVPEGKDVQVTVTYIAVEPEEFLVFTDGDLYTDENGVLWQYGSGSSYTYTATNQTFTSTNNIVYLQHKVGDQNHAKGIDFKIDFIGGSTNETPVAVNDTFNVNMNETLTVSAPGLMSNDTDPDNTLQELSVTNIGTPNHGTITSWNADGSFTYQPNTDYSGTDNFSYTISDGNSTSNGLVEIIVNSVSGQDTLTLSTLADSYVQGGTSANNNYGSSTSLIVKGTGTGDYDRFSYLKFDLSTLTQPVVEGKLQLHYSTSTIRGVDHQVYLINDDSWGESSITFNNQPSTGSLITTQTLPSGTDVVEYDITNTLEQERTGDGTISLKIVNTTADWGEFSSKEIGTTSERPVLIITTGGATNETPVAVNDTFNVNMNETLTVSAPGLMSNDTDPDNTLQELSVTNIGTPNHGTITSWNADGSFTYQPNTDYSGTDNFSYTISDGNSTSNGLVEIIVNSVSGQDTLTLSTLADSYVQGGTSANNNYGSSTSLIVKGTGTGDYDRFSYLKFDLSTLTQPVVEGKLQLHYSTSTIRGVDHQVYLINDDSWGESSITFNNQPSTGSLITTQTLPSGTDVVEYDITNTLEQERTGDGTISLKIVNTTADWGEFSSKESDSEEYHPKVILITESQLKKGKFSSIISQTNNTTKIFPVPVVNTITVKGSNEIKRMELINLVGQVVRMINVNDVTVHVDMSSTESGIYFLKFVYKDGTNEIRKIVKK